MATPGEDGVTVELYKLFSDQLILVLKAVFQEAEEKTHLKMLNTKRPRLCIA